jgi:hypothetical protein
MTIIDPLQVVIQHLGDDATLSGLVGTRIDMQHHYQEEVDALKWAKTENGIQVGVRPGSSVELYVQWQRPRLVFRCYGATRAAAWDVYLRLVEISRASHRQTAVVADGTGLMYWLNMTSGASFLVDTEIDMPYVQVFAEAAVNEVSTV